MVPIATTAMPRMLEDAALLTAEAHEALAELLLALADDEFVLGFWDSEWTGIAPVLEEDVAYSSIAQDEIGHARALYELLAPLAGRSADVIAYDRDVAGFRQARLLDLDRGDWATSIARRYLYDTADAVRLAALSRSSYAPLAGLVGKLRREEAYHLQHFDSWLRRLANDDAGRRAWSPRWTPSARRARLLLAAGG
ncbi:MAG: 1,2-phenylacetyl-CoA epoxidase subunit PaaC [Chloroflexia bacterium]